MATQTQLDRLEALIVKMEASVRRAFREFIRMVNSEEAAKRIADLIERGDINGAMAIVDSHVERFANVLPLIQQQVGIATAAELATTASEFVLAINFDPSFPRAATMARGNRLHFIRDFTTEQRQATRLAIANAFEDGAGTFETARAFRASIGLNSQQVAWARSFEQRLRELDSRALQMDLRDRRYDRAIRRAIRVQKPLGQEQIQSMVERYRARALQYRSEVIARTEAGRAASQARHESLLQMTEQTGMDPRRVIRVWHSTRDNRVRDWHASMEGQRVGIEEKFIDGNGNHLRFPHDEDAPAETTVNCRCTTTMEFKPPLNY